MEKLRSLPHKYLFYIGLLVVFTFLGLSYWQFSRYQNNHNSIFDETTQININLQEVNELQKNIFIKLDGTFTLVDHYKLRSRVHNGNSGYHVIAIYKNPNNVYLTVNHGWIPLENNIFKIGNFRYVFEGFLLDYDLKSPVGQNDEFNSDFLFRIDKNFIENDQKINLTNKYILLRDDCGSGIECVQVGTGYKPPHLSYSFQWLFFAICFLIVILRKNKFV